MKSPLLPPNSFDNSLNTSGSSFIDYLTKKLPFQLSLVNALVFAGIACLLITRRSVFDVYAAYPTDYAFSELVIFYIYRKSIFIAEILAFF